MNERHAEWYNGMKMIVEERTKIIDNLAKRDNMTKDKQYNDGLRLIREYGYRFVSAEDAVKYYCMCNAL